MSFPNVYNDEQRAASYATLEFPGTYYLAYRDLPEIISIHVSGKKALDFGCGAGRSTRFLKRLQFDAVGVDIAEDMLQQARLRDATGDYRLLKDNGIDRLPKQAYDLVLAAFTFDNIPNLEKKVGLFRELGDALAQTGRIINVVSAPEIYMHEWASFTTKDFPENRNAQNGERVKIIMTDVADRRPVEDILWTDEAYREVYTHAGLEVVQMYKPLAKESEPFQWITETRVAPWTIYVLRNKISNARKEMN